MGWKDAPPVNKWQTAPPVGIEVAVSPQTPSAPGARAQAGPRIPQAAANPLSALADEYTPLEAGLIGAGRTATRLLEGGRDLTDVPGAFIGNEQALQSRRDRQASMAEADRLYQPLSEAHPVATTLGESVPYMAAPGMSTLPRAMATAGGMGLLEYDADPIDRVNRALMTAGAAGISTAAVRGLLGRGITENVDDYTRTAIANGERLGFRTRPSIRSGGNRGLQIAEAKMRTDPRTTGTFEDLIEHNTSRFNRVAAKAFGSDAERLTPEVLRGAKSRLGKEFEDVAKGVDVTLTPALRKQIMDIANEYKSVAGRGGKRVQKTADQLLEMFDKNGGKLSAKEYMRQASGLVQDGMGMMNKKAAEGHALFDMRKVLDDAFDQSAPAGQLDKLKKARDQYRQFLYVKDATDVNGNVSWNKLNNALMRKDEWGYALGNKQSDLYDALKYLKLFPENFGRPGTAESQEIPSLLSRVRRGAAEGAAVGALLDPTGFGGTGATAGALLGGSSAAAEYALAPMAAKAYFSAPLNRGLLNPAARTGAAGLLARQDVQNVLKRAVTPALLSMAPDS